MIDLGFVQGGEKLLPQYMQEFALSLPKVNLLWDILIKNQAPPKNPNLQITKVKRNDIFTILAAILDL